MPCVSLACDLSRETPSCCFGIPCKTRKKADSTPSRCRLYCPRFARECTAGTTHKNSVTPWFMGAPQLYVAISQATDVHRALRLFQDTDRVNRANDMRNRKDPSPFFTFQADLAVLYHRTLGRILDTANGGNASLRDPRDTAADNRRTARIRHHGRSTIRNGRNERPFFRQNAQKSA